MSGAVPGPYRTCSAKGKWMVVHKRGNDSPSRYGPLDHCFIHVPVALVPCTEQQPDWPCMVHTAIVLLWSNCELAMYGTAAALAVAGPYRHCAAMVELWTCHVRNSSRIGRGWSVLPLCCYCQSANLPCTVQQPHWPWLVRGALWLLILLIANSNRK